MPSTPAPTKVDVAVIGSGFGGLTAAALAARTGLQTALFEQHTRPGGCAGDFGLGGFWFPAGATVVTGLEEGGILTRVFEAVGVNPDSTPLDPSIVFRVGDVTIPYARNFDEWLDTYQRTFPDAPNGYVKFWKWTHQAGGVVYRIGAKLPSLPLERWADVRRTAPAASPEVVRLAPYLLATVERAKRLHGAVGHPASDQLIDSLLMDATGATAEHCSAVQGAIALDLYRRGCQWVEGGTGRLAMQLVRAIRAEGGSVTFGDRVTGLTQTADGWTIFRENGESVAAKRVIANVPPAALGKLLGRPAPLPTNSDAWGAFVLHMGIDGAGLDPVHPFQQVVDDGGHSIFVSVYRGPRERWSISASTHVRTSEWQEQTPEADDRRREMEQMMVRAIGRVIPDVQSRIVLLKSATPRTYERFTGRPGGFVGGLIQRPTRVALRAPGHRPDRHLYMTGDHVFPGQGTVGVALSGINAYRDVVESFGRRPLL